MSSELEDLIKEVGATDFRPKSEDRRESLKDNDRYDPDADTSLSLGQVKRFSELSEGQIVSTHFRSDEEFFEVLERVLEDWPEVEFRFGGMLDLYGYIDGIYIIYENIDDSDISEFEEYCVIHFKDWIDKDPSNNKGISQSDDRISISHEDYRDDDNLWASPTEFNFYDDNEYPQFGDCLRLWWDD